MAPHIASLFGSLAHWWRMQFQALLDALERYCGSRATALTVRLAMATAILVLLDLALLRIVNLPLHVVILNSLASVSGLESDVVRSALILFWSVVAVIIVTLAAMLIVGFIRSHWPWVSTKPSSSDQPPS